MRKMKTIIAGALIGAVLAGPALAGEEKACVQNNRMWGWEAKDDHTLIITDREYKKYTVTLRGGCIGLGQYAKATLTLRTFTSLGCLEQGDRVAFDSPGLGRLTCFVAEVKAGVPPPKPAPAAE
jgi:hypothetical protein